MAKLCHDDVLDAGLLLIRSSANLMVVLPSEPASYAAAQAAKLAQVAMVSGDFTLANGVTSGRRITVAAKSAISVTASGTGNHVALLDTTGLRLLYVTTPAAMALTSGGTCNLAAWDIELRDPA